MKDDPAEAASEFLKWLSTTVPLVEYRLPSATALQLLGALQLALRHPEFPRLVAADVRRWAEGALAGFLDVVPEGAALFATVFPDLIEGARAATPVYHGENVMPPEGL